MMGSNIENFYDFHTFYILTLQQDFNRLQNNKRYESFIFSRINDKFNYKQYVI